jgi:predicted O-methyltransferase YrrM
MYSSWQIGNKYLRYYFNASNGRGHGIHSPFVYDFVRQVLMDKRMFYAYPPIEALRQSLLQDNRQLEIRDFGAGSRQYTNSVRRVKDIARSSLKSAKFGQLLFRMVNHYAPLQVLELGTSLGITTAYLASASPLARITTMEGAPAIAATAQANFEALGLSNINLVEGNFDDTLPGVLGNMENIDMVFIDGNHRYAPTVAYFEQILPCMRESGFIVFDDIHWSSEMEAAWNKIQQHPAVTLTIDLFFIGIVFFRTEQKVPQHFSIRF